MHSQIDEYTRRPKQYFNVDGAGELSTGVMILSFGLFQYLQMSSPPGSIWNRTYTLLAFAAVLGAVTHYGPRALKQHFTHPRTGYVKYRKAGSAQWAAIALAVLIAMMAAGALVRSRGEFGATPALVGIGLAASYGYGFARAVPWKRLVALALALGAVGIAALPPEITGSWADSAWTDGPFPAAVVGRYILLSAFYGVTLLGSGAITFGQYLRNTRPNAMETE